ncbi:hypothetical protein BD410DRAFT_795404 [Rickenella mellea]|uniref:Uncharacterized protein n=1 Tax=Rickenella mellea TaxID=50990 RepID=A0A4Y7PP86_9AGAM|nr:hypothetical protein BD410DRAFT_795404 [Rickenella mellea]
MSNTSAYQSIEAIQQPVVVQRRTLTYPHPSPILSLMSRPSNPSPHLRHSQRPQGRRT